MDQRAVIDVICKAALEKLPGEIGALLGQDLACSDIKLDLVSKATIFDNPEREKTAFTHMTVGGDLEGDSYLLSRLSTAAILAGTLIMLPEDMIEENVQSGKLDGELNDAFGEVANIIAGVFTQAFVDKYPKTLRFIKKEVEELVPTKIDLDSDAPFPPGNYYVASCEMKLGDNDLGPLELIVPARVFELEDSPEESEAADTQPEDVAQAEPSPEPTPSEEIEQPAAAEETPAPEPAAPAPAKPAFADAKKLTDVVFNATISQAGEEVGALLGQTLTCDDIKLVMTSKADFFSGHCIEKSIMTHMKVTGDKEGLGYMLVQVPDAVVLGGTLIMLPEDQIEEQKSSGELEGEVADSFGEIANILSGSLTQVFLDRYPKQIRFIKTETETIVPTKIDPAAEDPFPEGSYYLASFAIHMEGFELDRIQLIFPADVFDLDGDLPQSDQATGAEAPDAAAADSPAPGEWGGPPATASEPTAQSEQAPSQSAAESESTQTESAAATATAPAQATPSQPAGSPVVLVISDQEQATEHITGILSSAGYDCRSLAFQDEVRELFRQHQVLGIFLVMSQVGEKGFAAAIKLQAAGQPLPPIIFAGPEWTKSAVLKAVKYGAKDILITPASDGDIQDKLSLHIKKAS